MTLEEAKQSAPPIKWFIERQFILGTPENCHVIRCHVSAGLGTEINGELVIASRSLNPTDPDNKQPGVWMDYTAS